MQPQIKKLDFTDQCIYAGIDVHKNSWKVSIYSEELYHKTISQPPDPLVLHSYLEKHFPKGSYYSVYEAGFSGFWIHDQLCKLGVNNIVVNPADVPTTDKEKKRKTDKVDSNKLARQLRSGDLDPIYTHTSDLLEDRQLVRTRKMLVKDLSRYKNRIKSELYFFGIKLPEQFDKEQSYWSRRFMDWLWTVEFQRSSGTDSFHILLDQATGLRQHLLEINKKIRELAQNEAYKSRVELLISIPGVSLFTAMTFLTEIEDIQRFANREKLRSYIGLTPTSHSSGDKDIHGEIINRGNKILKSAIVESAWVAARIDPALHLKYINYCKRMKKNQAIIRVACTIVDIISYVLKNERPYVCAAER